MSAILVGTDGSPQHDRRVREAAHVARALSAPLHVVCCVGKLPSWEQRELDRNLPSDCGHLAGPQGQRAAALKDVRELIGDYCELHVTASEQRLPEALRRLARTVDGELYGTSRKRLALRLPAFGGGEGVRATA